MNIAEPISGEIISVGISKKYVLHDAKASRSVRLDDAESCIHQTFFKSGNVVMIIVFLKPRETNIHRPNPSMARRSHKKIRM